MICATPSRPTAAFSRAARVVTLELVNNRVVVNSMEPRNAIADFDPGSGRSTSTRQRKVRISCGPGDWKRAMRTETALARRRWKRRFSKRRSNTPQGQKNKQLRLPPTPITFIHCNAAVMAPLVPANVAIEQQAVNLHDPVDSLVIGRF
jgi:hypothetical protein